MLLGGLEGCAALSWLTLNRNQKYPRQARVRAKQSVKNKTSNELNIPFIPISKLVNCVL